MPGTTENPLQGQSQEGLPWAPASTVEALTLSLGSSGDTCGCRAPISPGDEPMAASSSAAPRQVREAFIHVTGEGATGTAGHRQPSSSTSSMVSCATSHTLSLPGDSRLPAFLGLPGEMGSRLCCCLHSSSGGFLHMFTCHCVPAHCLPSRHSLTTPM